MKARRPPLVLLLTGLLLLAGCGATTTSSSTARTTSSSTTAPGKATAPGATSGGQAAMLGFEGVPLELGTELAPASTTQTGTVDGIHCGPIEQLAYHIHAHLAVYVDGAPRTLPAGVGIPVSAPEQTTAGPIASGGQCIYWLHTHTSDGVIHIESPIKRVYTLGNFFDEWHQPLNQLGVGTVHGRITAFLNGRRWTQDPRAIPLLPHAVIQLNVGSPAAPLQTVAWSSTQL